MDEQIIYLSRLYSGFHSVVWLKDFLAWTDCGQLTDWRYWCDRCLLIKIRLPTRCGCRWINFRQLNFWRDTCITLIRNHLLSMTNDEWKIVCYSWNVALIEFAADVASLGCGKWSELVDWPSTDMIWFHIHLNHFLQHSQLFLFLCSF